MKIKKVREGGDFMLPIQITTRDIPISPALETHIRKKAEKLNQIYERITSCHVVIDVPQKHKHQGKLYNVRIDLIIPGKELVVTHRRDEDIYVAIRDAFDAILRQLRKHVRKREGYVKTHDEVLHGHVARILPDEGYGFIKGTDDNEYYFSMTNVSHPGFDQLSVGDAVEYIAEAVKEGRQAHRVIKERSNHETHGE